MRRSPADLARPEHAEEVAALGAAIADAAARLAAARGWNRQAAGVLAMRASMELLLLDASPGIVGAWVQKQGAELEALGGEGGTA